MEKFGYLIIFFLFISCSCQGQIETSTSALIASTNSQNITLQNNGNLLWLATIQIGTPPQTFQVQVDTGSNDVWVPSTFCHFCSITTRFNSKLSSTYFPTGQTMSQSYGSGECSGPLATDILGLANSSISQNFKMLFANQESGFQNGIMGISNNPNYTILFDVAYQAGQISSPIYGLALQPNPLTSYLIYGTLDPIIQSKVVWVNSVSATRWMLQVNSVSFNGQIQPPTQMTTAVIDSGTSCLVINSDLYNTLSTSFFPQASCVYSDQQQAFNCPCRPTAAQQVFLPTITIGFQGVSVDIPFQNYMLNYYFQSSGQCPLCVQPISTSQASFMLLGDPIFKSMIALFSRPQNQIGIVTP